MAHAPLFPLLRDRTAGGICLGTFRFLGLRISGISARLRSSCDVVEACVHLRRSCSASFRPGHWRIGFAGTGGVAILRRYPSICRELCGIGRWRARIVSRSHCRTGRVPLQRASLCYWALGPRTSRRMRGGTVPEVKGAARRCVEKLWGSSKCATAEA